MYLFQDNVKIKEENLLGENDLYYLLLLLVIYLTLTINITKK